MPPYKRAHAQFTSCVCRSPPLPACRTYLGVWQGAQVAVKVMEDWEEDEAPASTPTSDTLGAAPAPVVVSRASSSPSTCGTQGAAHEPEAVVVSRGSVGSPTSRTGTTRTSFGNAPLVEALMSKSLRHPHIVSWPAGRQVAGAALLDAALQPVSCCLVLCQWARGL